MSEWPVVGHREIKIVRLLTFKPWKTEIADSSVTLCLYQGPNHENEPLEGYRLQLGRPGGPFLFLTHSEWDAICEIVREQDE